ncbi:hypothetical protein BDV97DRAFT_348298 [Delphinella strobiligena]|nr:hypothetical protein BDV97DRAFT_348298 [Delphinella strobiligena]
MAKKDKGKDAAKKLRKAAKQEKVAKKTEKKSKNKQDQDSDVDDADLDAILAEYAKKQQDFEKVSESVSTPPPPRSASTLIASPSDQREIFLFGGEHYNGALATFSNDLYIYRIHNDEWRKVTSPNSPLPRSGHAMCRGGNTGGLYLFGGEFSSPKQGTFYHYNDFWRLEPSSREWQKVEAKGQAPSARSGHRMVHFGRYIIVFGGFQDTSQQTKYLNDLYIYDCQTFQWHTPALPPAAGRPEPRSSFSFLPHETGAVLYGGYSRIKTNTTAGKATKGGRQASRVIMKPVVHQDTWFLRITPPPSDAPTNTLPTVRWEKRKKPVNSPNPARAGATMTYHKGRGIAFGGVHDVEEDEEGIDSEFFNQLSAYNIDRNRFFGLVLRKPRAPGKKQVASAEKSRRGRGKADEEELLRNLALIEGKGSLEDADDTIIPGLDKDDSDDERTTKPEKPTTFEMPHTRFNAQLAVQDDVLYIYGGTFEKGDREFTFDEMHAIDLGKLDGVKEVFRRELEDWQGSDDEDSEDEEDEEDDEDEGSDEETEQSTPATSVAPSVAAPEEIAEQEAAEVGEEAEEPEKSDGLPHPRPFESLREFFSRTGNQWQEVILEEMKYKHHTQITERSVKEIRKSAFSRSEQKWWDCREEIQALEDEQEAAGIGEVVAIESRGEGGGGAGRRR